VSTPEEYIARWRLGAIDENSIDCISVCLAGQVGQANSYDSLAAQETLNPLRYSTSTLFGADTLQVLANLRSNIFNQDQYSVRDGLPVSPTINSPEPNFYASKDLTIDQCLVYCADNQWCNSFLFFNGPNRRFCRLKTNNVDGKPVTVATANYQTVSFKNTVNPPETRVYQRVTKRAFQWLSFGPEKNWYPNTDSVALRVFDLCTSVNAGLSLSPFSYANIFQYVRSQFDVKVPFLVQRQFVVNLVPLQLEFRRNSGCTMDIYSNDKSVKIPSCDLSTNDVNSLPCPSSFKNALEQFCRVMTEGFQPPAFDAPPTSHVGACALAYSNLVGTYPRFSDQLAVTRAFLLACVPLTPYQTGLAWFVNQTDANSQYLTGQMWLSSQVSQGAVKTNKNWAQLGAWTTYPTAPPTFGSTITSQRGSAAVTNPAAQPAAAPKSPTSPTIVRAAT